MQVKLGAEVIQTRSFVLWPNVAWHVVARQSEVDITVYAGLSPRVQENIRTLSLN